MRKMRVCSMVLGVLGVLGVCGAVWARVAPTDLRGLIAQSDVIVLARVDRVETIEGVRLAVLVVERTLMAPPSKEWALALTSLWVCDISTAVLGERGLFFLQPYHKGPEDTAAFPPRFQEIVAARGFGQVRSITHYGRGRMPLRLIDGEEHVAVYGDVALPPNLEAVTVKTSDKREIAWQRLVPLSAMLDHVRSLTPAPPSR